MAKNLIAFLDRINSDSRIQDEMNKILENKGKLEQKDIEGIAKTYGYELKPVDYSEKSQANDQSDVEEAS